MSVNKNIIKDIFDYKYLIYDEFLLLEVKKSNGEIWEIEIEKDEYEDLGIEFTRDLIDSEKSCRNKCIFCFIDQMPKGMRKTLYFKDDDVRLSFLTGNYVTLTNTAEDDLARILKYKMSPINISVHTTDAELRIKMLNNSCAGNILDKIKFLADGGIKINCQIVLCRDINDGDEMVKTINDLAEFYPSVQSISVVPVGLTKYREKLKVIEGYNYESAKDVINAITKLQNKFINKYGSRLVYIADEFYLMGKVNFPGYDEYEEFLQIENGVGLYKKFEHDFLKSISKIKTHTIDKVKISLITGTSIYENFKNLLTELEKKIIGLELDLKKIENNFFGSNVSVTGLIVGNDIKSQLQGKDIGEYLLICSSMLKNGEEMFLDNVTVKEIEDYLNVKILVIANDAKELINIINNIIQK